MVERLLRMRDLKQTVDAISAKYYDGHPLLFSEDERKLNNGIAWLEELSRTYNSFENDIPTVQPLNIDAEFRSTPARVEARVAHYEVIAKAKTWIDSGYPEIARELTDPYAMRVLRQMKQVGTA